jgi:hypothetical protein
MSTRWLFPLALVAGAALVWHATGEAYWSDFGSEAYPSYRALAQGNLHVYLLTLPPYGGYVTAVGAPFALVAQALGGIEELTFALTAVPAVIAMAVLTARLATHAKRPLAIVLVLGVPLPMVKLALDYGHPEDVLAAAASVGAVVAALRGRTTAAAALLALGIVSKQWAILAVLPAMLAAPARPLRLGVAALTAAAAVLLPIDLLAPHSQQALVSTTGLFHPQQVFWPFGVDAPAGADLPRDATVVAPAWVSAISHPLIVALALPLTALWHRRRTHREDALALLALLFLARCALDPWNIHYYHLPLVLALVAWEVERGRDLPVLSLLTLAASWLSFALPGSHYSSDGFVLYMAWTVPLAAYLWGAPLPSVRRWHAAPTSAAQPFSRSTSTT